MKKIYFARGILTFLAIGWMFLIFGFSNQEGDDSSSLSGEVSYRIVKTVADLRGEKVSEKQLWLRAEKIEYPVRKLAHMTEYAIMAMLWFFALLSFGVKNKIRFIIPVLIAFLYACTDEIHQLFIADRSGKFTDVLVDTSGAILMMLLIFIIDAAIRRRRQKQTKIQ